MSHCKVHNVGFYSPEAQAIYSMALDRLDGKLAIARSDASIEIWNLNHLPFIEKTISASLENFSIEGLCWNSKRLFSVGLHGWLVEYDLYQLNMKSKWAVTGEAATCIDTHNNLIAIGTEQGYVNIYELTEDGAEFVKFLDKQEGRIISLKFSTDGEFVVGGSINAIRIWNVKTGHAIHKMVLGRSEAKKDTVVWCLEVLQNFSIFSGDSRGVLTLWDGKIGSQIESYQSHKADITAICLDESEESIYAAGVDPLISNFEKVKVGSNYKWVKSIQRKIHEHDVRAMVVHNKRLYSGGLDSYLVCSYHPPKTLLKYAPILQSPCIQVATKARYILLRYSKHVEIWSLGAARKKDDSYRGILELKDRPTKMVVLQKTSKNWAGELEAESIVCSCISSSGTFVFIGTTRCFCLYILEMENGKPNLKKLEDLDDSNIPCVQGAFNDKHNQLIVCLENGNLVVYDLEEMDPYISQVIAKGDVHLSDTVSILKVSSCGKFIIVADNLSNIVMFRFGEDGYSFYTKLPRYSVPPTALEYNPGTSCIVVAYADNKVQEYNISEKKFTHFAENLEKCSSWKSKTHPIRSITFDKRNKNYVLLHDDSNIILVDREPIFPKSADTSKKTKGSAAVNGDSDNGNELNLSIIQKYKHLVHLESLSEDELVAVEVNPLSLLQKLPPAFAQKTFGSK